MRSGRLKEQSAPHKQRTDVPETNGRIVSSNPGSEFSLNMPILTPLPLNNTGVSFCATHFVPPSVATNSGLDDCLSVRCVMANEECDTRVSDPLKEVEVSELIECLHAKAYLKELEIRQMELDVE